MRGRSGGDEIRERRRGRRALLWNGTQSLQPNGYKIGVETEIASFLKHEFYCAQSKKRLLCHAKLSFCACYTKEQV